MTGDVNCCRIYTCTGCHKTALYLSESWSTVRVLPDAGHFHHCLSCRSQKVEWKS